MQRHKSQCSRENVALSSGTLFDIVRLSLGILTLIPPPPPSPSPSLNYYVAEMAKSDEAKYRT